MLDLHKWQERYRLYWMHKGALQGLAVGLLAVGFTWVLWGRMFWLLVPIFAAAGAIVRWNSNRSEERLIKELDHRAGLNQRLLTFWQVSQKDGGDASPNPFLKPLARSIEASLRPMLGREVFPLQWWPESVVVLFLAATLTSGYWLMQEQPQVGLLTQQSRISDETALDTDEPIPEEFDELLEEEAPLPGDLPPSSAGLDGDPSDIREDMDADSFSAQDRAIARDRAARLVEEEIREIPQSTQTERDVQSWSADPDGSEGSDGEVWEPEERDPLADEENGASMIIDGLEDSNADTDPEAEQDGTGDGQPQPAPDEDPFDEAGVGQGEGDGDSPQGDPDDLDFDDGPRGDADESEGESGDGIGAGDQTGRDGEAAAPFDESIEFFDAQLEGQVIEDQWLIFMLEDLGEMDAQLDPTQLEERLLSYRQELLNQLSQETIPLRYREWIRDYFSLITAN